MAPQQEEEQQLPVLQFNEPLSWRAGRPIAIADLLKRLQTLAAELQEMEQEEVDPGSLTRVAKELAHQNLLGHKDKGVKAWTACCLVDIFRLCAPNAPFTEQQLRDIFTMMITHILPSLSDTTNAFSKQHIYVLRQLAQVKSIVLITDISNSDSLILHLFTTFFDILSGSAKASTGERLGNGVEFHMMTILSIMVDEAPQLPPEAVDSILAQFLRTDPRILGGSNLKGKKNSAAAPADDKQSTFVLKELPPAYNVAKTICNQCPDKMAREISAYFTDVITEATSVVQRHRKGSNDMHDEGSTAGPTEEDMKDLRKAHALIRELWRASPAVLQNVIPQLEAELSAENVNLRLLATETFGDIISGIGSAGPPPPPMPDVAAYPLLLLSNLPDGLTNLNILTTPSSPQPFPQVHPQSYSVFLGRRQDKSPIIRAAWTAGVGRILSTSAGGVGLSQHEEKILVEQFARMFNDSDERVRLAAIRAVSSFSFKDVIIKLGSTGGVNKDESLLANLAARVKDKKPAVRAEAMKTLSCLWVLSLGEIADGNVQVISLLGGAPSNVFNAFYVNDVEMNMLLDHAIFEILWPINYPPKKPTFSKLLNGHSQRITDGQTQTEEHVDDSDPNKIRVERMLFLLKGLDERARKVFFSVGGRPKVLGKFMTAYIDCCEDYNGGIMDTDEKAIKDRLSRLISELAKLLPDSGKVSERLWRFAKMHDRRSYQLIRFCLSPDSDFHTIYKAVKEFTKRITANDKAPPGLLESIIPLLYRSSVLLYNKTHVPAIMEFSKSDEKSLGSTAQDVLRDISSRSPDILTAHITAMCRDVQAQAPTASESNPPGIVDTLKACAAFAKQYTKEIPRDRKFIQAMTNFALYGTPPEASKHAVSIIMAISDKKEMVAKDLLHQCVNGFQYGDKNFLSRLATLSQLWLLVPTEIDEDGNAVIDIACKEIIMKTRTPSTAPVEKKEWSNELDEECSAKCWALKILVNRLRSHPKLETLPEVSGPIFKLLTSLISNEGEVSPDRNTPPAHKSRLRLLAARYYLKICTSKPHELLLTANQFNKLAEVAQDSLFPVRTSFLARLRKYLTAGKLPPRFYTIAFLLAFEPEVKLKAEISTWLKSRMTYFVNLKAQQSLQGGTDAKKGSINKASTILESIFARLISVLAHHPDFADTKEDLIDFSRYFIFYLSNIANEENISLIYHIAQTVKSCRDAVFANEPKAEEDDLLENWDERLYTLSELAQMTIRCYEEAHSWSIQTLPTFARISLPRTLFAEIKDHKLSIRIAEKSYLPEAEDIREGVEELVKKKAATSRKRKSEGADLGGDEKAGKKIKRLPVRENKPKTPARKKPTTTPRKKAGDSDADDDDESDAGNNKRRPAAKKITNNAAASRRSVRASGASTSKNYADRDSSEDEKELEELNRDSKPAEEGSSPDTEAGDEMDVDEKAGADGLDGSQDENEEEEKLEEEFNVPALPLRTAKKAKGQSSVKAKASPKSTKKAPAKAPTPTKKAAPKTTTKAKAKPKGKARGKA